MLFAMAGIAAVLMSWRAIAPRESGHGEFNGLLIFSVLGMAAFVSAQNLITLFLGIELLSIPLYILCASETRREGSLESGLKYLIVGSVGLGHAGLRPRRWSTAPPGRPTSRRSAPRCRTVSWPAACSATRWCSPASD